MISFSPNSRYTAQKIADKVSHGAYFYSHFSISDDHIEGVKINKVLEKLNQKYDLELNARQRTYRLNVKKQPIADLIIQKRYKENIYDFWLMITTPKSHQHNKLQCSENLKNLAKQRVSEIQDISFTQSEQAQEVELIQSHFDDFEKFKSVLSKPFLRLKFGKYLVELVRLSHSSKKYKNYDSDRKSEKNYTWTWRYDEPSIEMLKKRYIEIMNHLISYKDKSIAIEALREFYSSLNYYVVFKGNRHQIGKLFVHAVNYHFKKTSKDFRKMDYYVELKLNYLPRQSNYVSGLKNYILLRHINEESNEKFDQYDVYENYNELLSRYLNIG